MGCPVCGGSDRRPIGRGYWQCESPVLEPGWVPNAGARALRPGPVERACGHRYQDGTRPKARADTGSLTAPTSAGASDVCWCGMSAIAWCVACGAGSCGDHLRYFDGRVVCGTHEAAMQAAEEQRRRPARDAYARQAEADRAEYERLTPGMPYPERNAIPVTYADLRRQGPLKAHGQDLPVGDVVRVLEALVPDRIVRGVVVQSRTGLLSRRKTADGWVFTTRRAATRNRSTETQHDPWENHDGWWRTLLLSDGQMWKGHGFVEPGAPLPPPTNIGYMPAHAQHGSLVWADVSSIRDEVLTWLGRPPRPPSD